MKRILIGILCVCGALWVHAEEPWAELKYSVAVREGESVQLSAGDKRNRPNKPEHVTVLPAIVEGKTIKVSIYPPDAEDEPEEYKAAKELVSMAYNDWFDNAVKWIVGEHREREFADVLPILKRGVKIKFVEFAANKHEDVWIGFMETMEELRKKCRMPGSLSCESPGNENQPIMVVLYERGTYITMIHELGHTLGIADAYDRGYEQHASDTYRSEQRIYLSVMNKEKGNAGLSGDDADGLINMIDSWTIYAKKKQHPKDWQKYISSRILNGWNSLQRYKTGSSVDRYRMGTSEKVLQKTQREQPSRASGARGAQTAPKNSGNKTSAAASKAAKKSSKTASR